MRVPRRPQSNVVDRRWEELAASIQRAKEERVARLQGYEDFVEAIEALLFERDPIGINFEDNTDEYRSEAETITLRLRDAQDLNDTERIVHEEFVYWFGQPTAGPREKYGPIAADIWALWRSRGREA